MSKKLLGGIVAVLVVVVFCFQNCQKNPTANGMTSISSSQAQGKVNLQDENVSQIDFLIQENETVTRVSRTYQLVVNKTLKINLTSGVFQVVSDLGGAAAEYCLTNSLKDELVSLLKSSQICKSEAVSSGQVCAQVVKRPYAQVLTDINQYDLGGASDSCGSNSQDLCGSQASMLQGYLAALKSQYKNLICR